MKEEPMTSIRSVKESVGVKLDKLDARADAFHAALEATDEQIGERVGRRSEEAQRVLGTLAADIDQQKEFSDERRRAIRSEVDNLNEQITLSRGAARETLAATRREIDAGIQKMEAEVDAAFAESQSVTAEVLKSSVDAYVRAMHRLDAELEAVELCFASAKDKVGAQLAQRRQELAQEIVKLKQRLAEKTTHGSERLVKLEEDLRGGFERLVKAFKGLVE
jgi:hypothetical protein